MRLVKHNQPVSENSKSHYMLEIPQDGLGLSLKTRVRVNARLGAAAVIIIILFSWRIEFLSQRASHHPKLNLLLVFFFFLARRQTQRNTRGRVLRKRRRGISRKGACMPATCSLHATCLQFVRRRFARCSVFVVVVQFKTQKTIFQKSNSTRLVFLKRNTEWNVWRELEGGD